jgi:hypothetical protein
VCAYCGMPGPAFSCVIMMLAGQGTMPQCAAALVANSNSACCA